MSKLQQLDYLLFMLSEQVDLKKTRYYQLINVAFKQALYIKSDSKNFQDQRGYLNEESQERLGQLWQVIKITQNLLYKDCYQIVHARSTLVLTNLDGRQMKLRFGEQKTNQLFMIQKVLEDSEGTIWRFASYENKLHFLHYDKMIKVSQIQPTNTKCHWYVKPVCSNPIINRSCYFQNSFDNLVIDVPEASLKTGCQLIQYYFNNRFNQRFIISETGGQNSKQYKIQNFNSKLYLTAHKKCRDGDKITQQEYEQGSKQQKWIIEYQGKNLFGIRSVLNPQMMIGTKDAWFNLSKPIITTSNDDYSLWKIVGCLPNRAQLTEM